MLDTSPPREIHNFFSFFFLPLLIGDSASTAGVTAEAGSKGLVGRSSQVHVHTVIFFNFQVVDEVCARIFFFFHHCIRWSAFPGICKPFYFIDSSPLFPFLSLPLIIRMFLLVLLTHLGFRVLMPLPLIRRSRSVLWFRRSSLVLMTLLVLSTPMVVGWRASSNSNGSVGRVFRNLNLRNTRREGMG